MPCRTRMGFGTDAAIAWAAACSVAGLGTLVFVTGAAPAPPGGDNLALRTRPRSVRVWPRDPLSKQGARQHTSASSALMVSRAVPSIS